MSQNVTDDYSTLVQVMTCSHQATSHYLSQCWPRSLSPFGITKPQWVNFTQAQEVSASQQAYLVIAVTSHEHCDISDHWQINCLLSKLFRLTTKKTPKLHYLSGESTCDRRIPLTKVPVTGGFPSQRVSHAGSISWCLPINSRENRINFTCLSSTDSLEFLDTTIHINDGVLNTELFIKPTNSLSYLERTSFHPNHTFTSLPYGEFVRARRNCSTAEAYEIFSQKIKSAFLTRVSHDSGPAH